MTDTTKVLFGLHIASCLSSRNLSLSISPLPLSVCSFPLSFTLYPSLSLRHFLSLPPTVPPNNPPFLLSWRKNTTRQHNKRQCSVIYHCVLHPSNTSTNHSDSNYTLSNQVYKQEGVTGVGKQMLHSPVSFTSNGHIYHPTVFVHLNLIHPDPTSSHNIETGIGNPWEQFENTSTGDEYSDNTNYLCSRHAPDRY